MLLFFENKQDLDKYAALEVSSKHMDWDQEYICLVVCRAAAEKLFFEIIDSLSEIITGR